MFARLSILLIILALNSCSAFRRTPSPLTLPLLRRPAPSPPHRSRHYVDLARRDALRRRAMDFRQGACESFGNGSSSFAMAMRSGAYAGNGEYFVRAMIGTPAQRFLLVADTGSDLTWMRCRLDGGSDGRGERVFRPERSKTFQAIGCATDFCKAVLPFSLTVCPTPASPCSYDYGYSDGSSSQGIYANESATIIRFPRRRAKLRNLIIGCSTSSAGSSFRGSDGVLGLGYSDISFAKRATSLFGGRFSYCLVDHLSPRNVTSFLTFGPSPDLRFPLDPHPTSTDLLLDPNLVPFYGVNVDTITVAGVALDIPSSVWNVSKGGGTIVDSGTGLTVLVEPAYRAVVANLSRWLEGLPRVSVEPFEYCYNWTEPREVPELAVHFTGMARLEPPSKSYVIDVSDGVKCIGFTSTPWPGLSVIGNIMQQEHVWEFDLKDRRLRFRRSECVHR